MYGYEVFHEDKIMPHIKAARENHVHQAYIFEGEKGIGKLKAARLFAASLVCENGKLAPCGNCPACIGARADTNPDIRYISSDTKKSIGVDIMREIITDAYIRPFESRKKVYVIKEGDLLTEQAQNSFLKILEEPPEYTIFIILVSNLSSLLETIKSRCNIIRFTSLKKDEIKEYIKKNYPDYDADFLANYAEGNPGKVDELMEQEGFFALRQSALKMILSLVSSHKISAYKVAEFMEENKDDAEQILQIWQSMIRDIIFIQNNASYAVINSDILLELSEFAGRIPDEISHATAEAIKNAISMQRRYVNLRALALNMVFSIRKE